MPQLDDVLTDANLLAASELFLAHLAANEDDRAGVRAFRDGLALIEARQAEQQAEADRVHAAREAAADAAQAAAEARLSAQAAECITPDGKRQVRYDLLPRAYRDLIDALVEADQATRAERDAA